MVQYTIPSKSFEVTSIKRARPDDIDETLAQNVPEIIGSPLAFIPRLGAISPQELDFGYGVVDQPGTEFIEWFLVLVDVDNLPTLASIRARSVWWRAQQWRTIGTDNGPIQTMTQDRIDFLNSETYTFSEVADFTQRLALCAICNTDASSARIRVLGVLTYSETVIQRVFGSDNWTDNEEFGDQDDSGSSS